MSAECGAEKRALRANTPESPENVSQSVDNSFNKQTEFVNIKVEVECVETNVRIKQEPIEDYECDPAPSTQNPVVCSSTPIWHVPITSGSESQRCTRAEVFVKAEPIEYDSNESHQDSTSSEARYLEPVVTLQEGNRQSLEEAQRAVLESFFKFTCNDCGKKFVNKGNLQRHLKSHSREKFTCRLCARQFYFLHQIIKHMQKHGDKPHKCEDCGKVFNSSSNLQQHKRIHLANKPFVCDLCQRTFTVRANLLKHKGKSRCKKPIDHPIVCHICNKVFPKEFLLKSHLRRHTTERPFVCDLCDMTFKYKSTLIRHIQLHNGVKPYSCEVCNKTFTSLGLIKPHMRIHTGEKPFTCPVCKKMFAHKHNMQRHALRHEKSKNLTCHVCSKVFPKESRLIYHMRIHTNEKFFACSVCPKKFSHRQNILRHYTRKHPGATYDCKDTDASVALKVWEDMKKERIKLVNRGGEVGAGKPSEFKEQSVGKDPEYIVPDVLTNVCKLAIKEEKPDHDDIVE